MQPNQSSPETSPAADSEKSPVPLERAQPTSASAPPPSPLPVAPSATPAPAAPPVASPNPTSAPATAEDSEEIESTWVEQADKIIQENQTDPYNQEEAAEALSQDYKRKRFGIDVNKS